MMLKQQNGNSIIEILAASAIVIFALTASTSYILQLKTRTQRLLSSRSQSIQIEKAVQLILSDPKLLKVNFDSSEAATCEALNNSDLPLAWDNNNTYTLADCPGCKGRLGYVIQPFPLQSIRGVYLVTIRLTHPQLTAGLSTTCNGVTISGTEQLQMIVSLR